MSLANIIKIAKGEDEEKVAMSLKVPASIKNKLDEFAKENKISVNALINAMIKNGFDDVPADKELLIELNNLEKEFSNYSLREEDGGELFNGFMVNPGAIDAVDDELVSLTTRIKALRKILN